MTPPPPQRKYLYIPGNQQTIYDFLLIVNSNRVRRTVLWKRNASILRNVTKTQKNKLYESAKERYTETHGTKAHNTCFCWRHPHLTLLWNLRTTFLKTTLMWILNSHLPCGLKRGMCLHLGLHCGHPRSLIFAPIESAYVTSYWSSIVTLVLSCRVSEILELLYAESHFLIPRPYFGQNFRVFPLE